MLVNKGPQRCYLLVRMNEEAGTGGGLVVTLDLLLLFLARKAGIFIFLKKKT